MGHNLVEQSPCTRRSYSQERKYQRFPLRYPVKLQVFSGEIIVDLQGVSRNVSIGGLLLDAVEPVPSGSSVSFTMIVKGVPVTRAIELAGEGNVVRVEADLGGSGFAIAVECSRPMTQIATYFSYSAN